MEATDFGRIDIWDNNLEVDGQEDTWDNKIHMYYLVLKAIWNENSDIWKYRVESAIWKYSVGHGWKLF